MMRIWYALLVLVPITLVLESAGLVFNSDELVALVVGAPITALISLDGESNWPEGAELVALYVVLGIAFYFVP